MAWKKVIYWEKCVIMRRDVAYTLLKPKSVTSIINTEN
jgi:hypothetical protein